MTGGNPLTAMAPPDYNSDAILSDSKVIAMAQPDRLRTTSESEGIMVEPTLPDLTGLALGNGDGDLTHTLEKEEGARSQEMAIEHLEEQANSGSVQVKEEGPGEAPQEEARPDPPRKPERNRWTQRCHRQSRGQKQPMVLPIQHLVMQR